MKRGSIFETDGIPRIQEALPLALQHVVAMIVGCVTPAIIVAGAAGLENKDQVILIVYQLVCDSLAVGGIALGIVEIQFQVLALFITVCRHL